MNPLASPTAVAQSGLAAATTRLAVSANNTANAVTDGFTPSRVNQEEVASGGVRVTISQEARDLGPQTAAGAPTVGQGKSTEPSRTDLIEETASRTLAAAAFRANLKSMQTADEVTGTLMDTVSAKPG